MEKKKPFPNLFAPGRIGKLEIKNRVVMAPMSMGFAQQDHCFSKKDINYYEARAKGGVGLIITESVLAETEISIIPPEAPVVACDSDSVMPGLKALAEAVHSYGTKIAMQLSPGQGRQSYIANKMAIPAAPSPVPAFTDHDITCRELTREEIGKIVKACGDGAERAAKAGFDMIEIHAHTGYLADQFMTPLWNKRTDEYGGTFEKRLKFIKEIIKEIRKRVGSDIPIGVRLSGEHKIEGGRTIEESAEIAKKLEAFGADVLHIDAGCYDANIWMTPPEYMGEACYAELAGKIKSVVDIPVITVGNIKSPETAEKILSDKMADFIGLGRSLLADPDWSNKAKEGNTQDIRSCLICNEHCVGKIVSACSVNPILGEETDYKLPEKLKTKNVLVIGGGPAGMEAARIASIRGHNVTLCEKEKELGGQLVAAAAIPVKKAIADFTAYLVNQVKTSGVNVLLGCEVKLPFIEQMKPDVVIAAAGAVPVIPLIPGIENEKNISILDFLSGKKDTGYSVAIAGGGIKGCEAAIYLAHKGKSVTIVERLSAVAADVNPISRKTILKLLQDAGINILTGNTIKAFTTEGMLVEDMSRQKKEIKADTVIIALGVKPKNDLIKKLGDRVQEIYSIGDCNNPRKIGDAIHEGFRVGSII
ncbi:FAD-dependent oxidoreductase [Ruminiclostridium cellobioparum]|uniref:NADH:flavin oxidoreductase/NADH oxidase n=1 Tax=Ruminiclostridium cellobioparum subsp. termitidis CT1112 TaxID=1195236 RepID=S0FN25_RUMCE|nr:FAD-dependent oxidoreductase [Ruminiclostridium cellobioparum]EMS73640.1 NADH:flavin oxidoreductase/NADH oxidase [Ruminiclostridium cellobioparum subsp. termitidis CT1112]